MKIIFTNMQFFAYHGVFSSEKENGNIFLVNLTLEIPDNSACETDNLENTLNYQLIYDVVKKEMSIPSNLLEHVTARIKTALLQNFNCIQSLTVRVSKKNPPLEGNVEWVSIEL